MGRLGCCLWTSAKILFVLLLVISFFVILIPVTLTLFPELPKFLLFRNAAIHVTSFEPSDHNLTGHNFYLPLSSGLIPVWHLVPPAEYSANNPMKSMQNMVNGNKSIILLVHGAFHSRFHPRKHPIYSKFLAAGYHSIAYDFRGFGENTGNSNGYVAAEETKAVYRWLRFKVGSRRIVVWTSSLGGAIAIEALSTLQPLEKELPRLVIESAFASLTAITRSAMGPLAPVILYLTGGMMRDYRINFDNVRTMPTLKTDIFHIHSEMDTLIPHEHATMIREAMSRAGRNENSVDVGTYRFKMYDKHHKLPHIITSSHTYNCLDDLKDFLEMTNISLKMTQNTTGSS